MTDKVIPIRLSHSSRETFLTCERKWQLDKLLTAGFREADTEHTVFGKAFGHGVAHYMTYRDKEMALFEAWKEYFPEIETDKKNQVRMLIALNNSFPKLDKIMETHRIAMFNGKPATELSFRMNINAGYYFVGYIDAVLQDIFTERYSVFECKSTGILLHDVNPLYKNSDQALGYSIALDRIAGREQSEYGLLYFVARMLKDGVQSEIIPLHYDKTLADRLRWFLTLAQDVSRLELCASLGVYPQRGSSCLQYNRACKYFNECGLTANDFPAERTEDKIEYDFVYELEDLLTDHMARVKRK